MVGIICAMSIEVDGIKKLMRDAEEFTYANMVFTKGKLDNCEVVAVRYPCRSSDSEQPGRSGRESLCSPRHRSCCSNPARQLAARMPETLPA